jgi:tetratricopeptide (TPR) repeat protein
MYMKKNISSKLLFAFALGLLLTACSEYLDILPKGQKIPTTLADFEALIRDEYGTHRLDASNAVTLLNDCYQTTANLNYYPLRKANYMWDETADRIYLNNSDEAMYYASYAAISTCNLIIEHAPAATESTEAERNEVIAYAKVLRAMNYFYLVNFYAETYQESNAAAKNAVPLITSANMGASYQQPTVKEIYDFILNDMKEALPFLKPESPTPLHPNLGVAYAFYTRVYLQMNNYPEALRYAELALDENDRLYDWTAYYAENKDQIENTNSYTQTASPTGHDYIENYYFRHGGSAYSSTENSISVERKAKFEEGDAKAAARWKVRTVGTETYCVSTTRGFFNAGGITTTEVYLIQAECLARNGKYGDAMDVLNKVRKTRILSDKYADLTATTEEQAIEYIRRTKDNELILTIIPFADARRYNLEPKYARTLSKVADGQTITLSPTSHLWTMPFPMGAINNPGNGAITQNVNK